MRHRLSVSGAANSSPKRRPVKAAKITSARKRGGTSAASRDTSLPTPSAAPTAAPCRSSHCRPQRGRSRLWCIVWCMKRTNIYLDQEQTALLDRLAAEEGVSRAEVIRRLLDRALASQDDSLVTGLAAIDESFGVLQDVDIPSRGAGDREEHLARMWQIAS